VVERRRLPRLEPGRRITGGHAGHTPGGFFVAVGGALMHSSEGTTPGEPGGRMHEKFEGERTLMRIHIGESDRWHGKPLYEAVV
jgi:hypothetical protein